MMNSWEEKCIGKGGQVRPGLPKQCSRDLSEAGAQQAQEGLGQLPQAGSIGCEGLRRKAEKGERHKCRQKQKQPAALPTKRETGPGGAQLPF